MYCSLSNFGLSDKILLKMQWINQQLDMFFVEDLVVVMYSHL